MKGHAIDTEEHTNDLLEHAQRKNAKWVLQRRSTARRDDEAHRLLGPFCVSCSVPSAGIVVAFLTERKCTRASLLNHSPQIVKILTRYDLVEVTSQDRTIIKR